MTTLTKLALGLIGQLRPEHATGYEASTLPLRAPQLADGQRHRRTPCDRIPGLRR